MFEHLYGQVPEGDLLPMIAFLSSILFVLIGGFWLLDSLKDTVFASIVGMRCVPTQTHTHTHTHLMCVLHVTCVVSYTHTYINTHTHRYQPWAKFASVLWTLALTLALSLCVTH